MDILEIFEKLNRINEALTIHSSMKKSFINELKNLKHKEIVHPEEYLKYYRLDYACFKSAFNAIRYFTSIGQNCELYPAYYKTKEETSEDICHFYAVCNGKKYETNVNKFVEVIPAKPINFYAHEELNSIINKIAKEFNLDILVEDFDYKTCQADGTNIFDVTKTGMSYYDQLIPGHPENNYMKKAKNLKGEIIYLTPLEYYQECAKNIFNTSVESLKKQRSYSQEHIEKLKKIIVEKKKCFPLTFLNYADKSQEGLHRMMVAGELFGWNEVKFPVLAINFDDIERNNREEKTKRIGEIKYAIKEVFKEVTRGWTYESLEDFKDAFKLTWKLDYYYLSFSPIIFEETDNNEVIITIEEASEIFDKSKIEIGEELEDDFDDLLIDYL